MFEREYSLIENLPDKPLARIFSFFKPDELIAARATCQRFHDMTSLKVINEQYEGMDVSADGTLLALSSFGFISIYDLKTATQVCRFRENQTRYSSTPIALCKDNKHILFGKDHSGVILKARFKDFSWKNSVEVKNLGNISYPNMGSVQVKTLTNGNFILHYAVFFKEPNLFVYHQDGKLVKTFETNQINFNTISISSDEKHLFCHRGRAKDILHGIDIFEIQGKNTQSIGFHEMTEEVNKVIPLLGNKKILYCRHHDLDLLDVTTNKIDFGFTYTGNAYIGFTAINISPCQKYFAVAMPGCVRICSLETGKKLSTILTDYAARQLYFTDDNQLIIGCGTKLLIANVSSVLELQEEFDERRYSKPR